MTDAAESMRLGLALSGGGLRASFFHIGVLARLAELDLLRRVEVLSCVSGGSIIGALYYLYLKRALDRDGDLSSSNLIDLVAGMERHFLTATQQNLRWLIFSSLQRNWWMRTRWKARRSSYSRVDRLGDLLEEWLYKPVWEDGRNMLTEIRKLKSHPRGESSFHVDTGNAGRHVKVPILMINATNLNSGHSWRFDAVRMGEPEMTGADRDIGSNISFPEIDYSKVPDNVRSWR